MGEVNHNKYHQHIYISIFLIQHGLQITILYIKYLLLLKCINTILILYFVHTHICVFTYVIIQS